MWATGILRAGPSRLKAPGHRAVLPWEGGLLPAGGRWENGRGGVSGTEAPLHGPGAALRSPLWGRAGGSPLPRVCGGPLCGDGVSYEATSLTQTSPGGVLGRTENSACYKLGHMESIK